MTCSNSCINTNGCSADICPDFQIKRFDTRPSFKIKVEDCEGALDTTGLICEVNMWAKAKLKSNLDSTTEYFALADNIGFNQIMVGDVIVMDQVRSPEKMLVTAFDELNKFVKVQRGYLGTDATTWKKGASMRILRIMNATATTEMILQDIDQIDGTTLSDQLVESYLVYEWEAGNTCLPGCYWLEFKLLKLLEELPESLHFTGTTESKMTLTTTPSEIPYFPYTGLNPNDFGCVLPEGVEWVRRFPSDTEGFIIQILDSPTIG